MKEFDMKYNQELPNDTAELEIKRLKKLIATLNDKAHTAIKLGNLSFINPLRTQVRGYQEKIKMLEIQVRHDKEKAKGMAKVG